MTSETVRQAAAMPDLNHRDPEYVDLVREVKERLLGLYPGLDEFTPYLLGGSGTAAVEAMATSCVAEGPVLILENGYYSSRLREIFAVHRIPHEALSYDWQEAWDMDEVAERLRSGRFEAVLGTHNETTTGRLNPIEELGAIGKRHGVRVLVDAMSSFGADSLGALDVDALCASANKCLHGIPGVSFVLVRRELAEAMGRFPRRTYYLSLPMYAGDDPPLTPPVPALAAFRQALREMGPEGATGRGERYLDRARKVRAALGEAGLELAVSELDLSRTLTTASMPTAFRGDYPGWAQANREHGFVIYGTKGPLRDRFFQVSTMGEIPKGEVERWCALLPQMGQR